MPLGIIAILNEIVPYSKNSQNRGQKKIDCLTTTNLY